jgi:hypothetical protein
LEIKKLDPKVVQMSQLEAFKNCLEHQIVMAQENCDGVACDTCPMDPYCQAYAQGE